MSENEDRFMERALELAREPAFTSPNPRVGAVVVRDDRIIGEGAHRGPGTPHAEVDALSGVDARGAAVYLNLEPCIHEGRTPPCVPRLIEAGITRVVVSVVDPDPRVAGRGMAALREAGIEVSAGLLERETRTLLASYLHHRSTGRAFLTLKMAFSLDGRLAAADGSSRWISDAAARLRVHERRVEADAILVGTGTVLADDPSLTARDAVAPRQPIRVIADATGRVPPTARVFARGAPAIVATTDRAPHDVQTAWKEAGAEVLLSPAARDGVDVRHLLEELGRRNVVEVLCEGGAALATTILRSGLADRLEIHRGPILLGGTGIAVSDLGVATIADASRWELLDHEVFGDTIVATYGKAGATSAGTVSAEEADEQQRRGEG